MFIPQVVQDAIGVLAAISVATAVVIPGSIAEGVAQMSSQDPKFLSIEHPSGNALCSWIMNWWMEK